MKIIQGDRIAKIGKIRLGCSAVIFNESREKVLLIKRTDNGQWCLPSGGADPGESVEETVIREVREETGLKVRVLRLAGVYSDPNWLVVYNDDNAVKIVALNFEAEIIDGKPGPSAETTDWGYFSLAEMKDMDMLGNYLQRVDDTFKSQVAAFIR